MFLVLKGSQSAEDQMRMLCLNDVFVSAALVRFV